MAQLSALLPTTGLLGAACARGAGRVLLQAGPAVRHPTACTPCRDMQSYNRFPRRVLRDMKRRRLFAEHELESTILKAIANNKVLPLSERKKAMRLLDKLPRDSRRVRIRDHCLYTGRSRGVIPEFGMSRLVFRHLADRGDIPGVRRSMW